MERIPRENQFEKFFVYDVADATTHPVGVKTCDYVPGLNVNLDGTLLSFSDTCSGDNEEVYMLRLDR